MPKIKSAIKRVKVGERNRARNTSIKSAVKTAWRSARTAISSRAADALAKVRQAVAAIDRAVSQGVVHRNTAARKKSRLLKFFNRTAAAPVPAEIQPAKKKTAAKKPGKEAAPKK